MAQFEIRKATNGLYYWVFQANNNEVICTSETYASKQNAVNSIDVTKRQGPSAPTNDKSGL
jgi:uncharacterized protein YegP (UPF0339 family)